MLADGTLSSRLFEQNRAFFSHLAPAAREIGIDPAEALLDLGESFAFFAGEGSPLTQANGSFLETHLDAIQDFFRGRATGWEAVLTPLDGPESLQRVLNRGATVMGWESRLYLPLASFVSSYTPPQKLEITEIGPAELAVWSEIGQKAFFSEPSVVATTLSRLIEHAAHMRRYIAYWDGTPAAAASLTTAFCDVAFFGGGGTLPEFRGRGIQTALIHRRLVDGAKVADVAILNASPGSSSHRNAERAGFRVAHSQLSLRVPV